jgi:TonB family protein
MSAPAEPDVTPIGIAQQTALGLSFTAYPPGTSGARALCSEVPILVLGYHALTEAGSEILQREPFEEESITMLLLVRGAVIRLAAPVARGQNLMLLNKEMHKYIHCRVANIRTSPKEKKYVELEFTHSAPHFWGISFPKEAVLASLAESWPQLPAVAPSELSAEAPWVVSKKAMAAAMGATPAMASVVAAAATTAEKPAAIPPDDRAPLEEPVESSSHTPFFLAKPTEGLPLCEPVRNQVEEVLAPPLPVKYESPRKSAPRRRRARRAIAAIAVLCAIYSGYRTYLAAADPDNASNSVVAFAAGTTEPRGDDSGATRGSANDATARGVTVTANAPEVATVEEPRRRDILISKMDMLVLSVQSDPHDAPEISVPAGDSPNPGAALLNGKSTGATLGLLSGTGPEPPPPPPAAPAAESAVTPSAPLTPARLLSSVQPIYPSLAKQAHIEGTVTIEAQIDAAGGVTGMKVLSGPQMLRDAATSAVRKWKFQPARLGDQPTPISVILSVRFILK